MKLHELVALRPRHPKLKRASRVAATPRPPNAAERAYVADLRRLVRRMGAVVADNIVANLPARKDDLAHPMVNEFRIVTDEVGKLVAPDTVLPTIVTQGNRVKKQAAKELGRVMGIRVDNDKFLGPLMTQFRDDNVALIKSLGDEYLGRVDDTLTKMYGSSVDDISAALQYDLGVAESRADLIATDQTLKLNGQLGEAIQTSVGVAEYVWTTAEDERVRPGHAALDGQRFEWSGQAPIVDPKTGRRAKPGQDFRCRCQGVPVVPEFSN